MGKEVVTADENNVQQSKEEDWVEGCFKENYMVPHICPVATGGWCKSYTRCKNMEGKNKRNVAIFRKSKWYSCMICNCKDESKLQNITITRQCHASSVVTFDICDDCLKQLGQDIADYYKE